MPDSSILLRELDKQCVLRLTLSNVARRYVLSEAMLAELGAAFARAASDPAAQVIILAAAGPAFCAKHNLKGLTAGPCDPDGGKAYLGRIMSLCSGVMQAIVACPNPVIAEVEGVATAAGCQLIASCDLTIAADSAVFSTPGVPTRLFCSTPMLALSRNVPAGTRWRCG